MHSDRVKRFRVFRTIFPTLSMLAVALIAACKEDDMDSLMKRLTPEQYHVTRECGTEPPFANAYWDNHEAGIYVDIVSGEVLFASPDKFDSGTGWPSFTRPAPGVDLTEKVDLSFGMRRVEVRSPQADSHLGHVFPDGPGPDGLRYCINSAALRFIPAADLEREGYGEWKRLFSVGTDSARGSAASEVALFAAGCFWGTEAYFRQLPGVLGTEVGYCGGSSAQPTYEEVCSGESGHAETLRIEFDPAVLPYRDLLRHFFRMHDPTSLDRQGNDVGTQYRSAVFATSTDQEATARELIAELSASGGFGAPIVTEVAPAGTFWPAETYHQDYLERHPGGYCHVDLRLARRPL